MKSNSKTGELSLEELKHEVEKLEAVITKDEEYLNDLKNEFDSLNVTGLPAETLDRYDEEIVDIEKQLGSYRHKLSDMEQSIKDSMS
jgi:predicted  nucleic acid-binding Zn-ribbon protein